MQGTAGLRSSLWPLLGPLGGRLCFLVDPPPPSLPPGLWLRGQEGTASAFRKTDLCGDVFFSFCDHAHPPDSGWVTAARPCLPLCRAVSFPVYPFSRFEARTCPFFPEQPYPAHRAAFQRGAQAPGVPFQHLPHGVRCSALRCSWDLSALLRLFSLPFLCISACWSSLCRVWLSTASFRKSLGVGVVLSCSPLL